MIENKGRTVHQCPGKILCTYESRPGELMFLLIDFVAQFEIVRMSIPMILPDLLVLFRRPLVPGNGQYVGDLFRRFYDVEGPRRVGNRNAEFADRMLLALILLDQADSQLQLSRGGQNVFHLEKRLMRLT